MSLDLYLQSHTWSPKEAEFRKNFKEVESDAVVS